MQQLFLPEFRYIKDQQQRKTQLQTYQFSHPASVSRKTVIYLASPHSSTKTTTSSALMVVLHFPRIAWTKSPLTELLIQESHLRNLHSGPQMTFFISGPRWLFQESHSQLQALHTIWRQNTPTINGRSASRTNSCIFCLHWDGLLRTVLYERFLTETAKIIRSYIRLFHHREDTLRDSGKSNQRRLPWYPQENPRKTRYSPSNLQWQFDNIHRISRRTRIQATSSRWRVQGSH